MARVLCDLSYPLERAQGVLEGVVASVESHARPWAGDDVVAVLAELAVGDEELARLPSLRVLATPTVGVDHVDVDAATRRGVWVCNVPDYCIDEVADHALALLLSLVRGVVELDRSVGGGDWDLRAAGALRRIAALRLGLVGFGRIGRSLAARAGALGMAVSAHDPFVADDEMDAAGVCPMTLPALFENCDAISIHAPLTPETDGLVGEHELALLPAGAYVVNVARAGIVDTQALLRALETGRLGGVALDVLDVEPPTLEHAAPSMPRLVVTPHAGWYSEQAEEIAYRRAAESVRDVLEGRRPRGAVNEPLRRP